MIARPSNAGRLRRSVPRSARRRSSSPATTGDATSMLGEPWVPHVLSTFARERVKAKRERDGVHRRPGPSRAESSSGSGPDEGRSKPRRSSRRAEDPSTLSRVRRAGDTIRFMYTSPFRGSTSQVLYSAMHVGLPAESLPCTAPNSGSRNAKEFGRHSGQVFTRPPRERSRRSGTVGMT